MNRAKFIRSLSGLSRRKFCDYYHIPYRTYEDWETDKRNPPEYVLELLERVVREDIEGGKYAEQRARRT